MKRKTEWHFSTLFTTGTNIAAVGKGGEEEWDRTENEFMYYYHVLELFRVFSNLKEKVHKVLEYHRILKKNQFILGLNNSEHSWL